MKKHSLGIIATIVSLLFGFLFYSQLPEQFAIHWNVTGEANGYVNKNLGIFIMPLIILFITFSFRIGKNIDPKKENYPLFEKSYNLIKNVFIVFFLIMQVVSLMYNAGYDIKMNIIAPLFISGILMVIGNYMPKIKHNYLIGIRTPWTLASEANWIKTHRFTGKLFIIVGIVILLSIFLSSTLKVVVTLVAIIGGVIVSFLYSYWQFKKEN